MQITGKTALVTGGSDGIGLEIARHLKARGAIVTIVGRNAARLASAAAEGFEALTADLSTIAGCDALVAEWGDRPLDMLVNNAGMGADFNINSPVDLTDVDRCIFLNLSAPIRLIAGLLHILRARPAALIVNVTSGLALAPNAGSPVYCATKAGLRSFTMALRAQLVGTSIQVLEALPPVVETQMTTGNPHKKMPAEECGRQIVAAISNGRKIANVGMTAVLNAVYNLSPAIARRVMLNYGPIAGRGSAVSEPLGGAGPVARPAEQRCLIPNSVCSDRRRRTASTPNGDIHTAPRRFPHQTIISPEVID